MKGRLEVAQVDLPDNVQLDDEIIMTLRMRVTAMQIAQVDVTGYGDAEPRYIDGERTIAAVALPTDA